MNQLRKNRIYGLLALLLSVAVVVGLVLFVLKQNINLFYTPTQVYLGEAPKKHSFRLGGLVQKNSFKHDKSGLEISFVLTDTVRDVSVQYRGALPDLFREGQGVIAQGALDAHGVFIASQVLAKHDENYMPPQVTYALKKAKGVS